MAILNFGGRLVGDGQPVFVIAEIGQNHQGCVETAKRMIEEATKAGVDCVKFQKSTLSEKYSASVLSRRYESPNAFGPTYGAHKRFLEFSDDQFRELQKKCCECGVLMTASAMDEVALEFLLSLNVPFIKIGSGDANNLRLVKKAAESGVPLVISTGMSEMETVERLYSIVPHPVAILQCTSSYPTPPNEINLNVIDTYRTRFPLAVVGYSGHEQGFGPTVAAVAKGARIIERHFTLDKAQKGSDHKCSLDPKDMSTLVEQIRVLDNCLGSAEKTFQNSEKLCFAKLGKSIVASRRIRKGDTIASFHLKVKVAEPHGWDPLKEDSLINRTAKVDIVEDEPITTDCVN